MPPIEEATIEINVLNQEAIPVNLEIVSNGAVYTFTGGLTNNPSGFVTLDTATTESIGGVIIGNNVNIENGVISVNDATTEQAGIIRIASLYEAQEGQLNNAVITPYTFKQLMGTYITRADISSNIEGIDYLANTGTFNLANGYIIPKGSDVNQLNNNTEQINQINNTLSSYGDIITHDVSDFATSAQGQLAMTSLQPGANISELTNNSGFITLENISSEIPGISYDNTTGIFNLTSGYQIPTVERLTNIELSINNEQDSRVAADTILTNAINNETTNRITADNNIRTYFQNNIDIINNTLSGYGDIVLHNANEFMPADFPVGKSLTYNDSILILKDQNNNNLSQVEIKSAPDVDYTTVSFNLNKELQSIGLINKNTNEPIYDWVGTEAEYQAAVAAGQIKPEYVCYITNDTVSETGNIVEWGSITGFIDNQTDLRTALDNKLNYNSLISVIPGISYNNGIFSLTAGYIIPTVNQLNNISNSIGNINDTLSTYGNIVTYNITDFATATQGIKADNALQPGDQITQLTNDANYITLASLSSNATGLAYDNQTGIFSLASGYVIPTSLQLTNYTNSINNINNTIDNYGNIVTYNTSDFATAGQGHKADTALQPGDNISALYNDVGYLHLNAISSEATGLFYNSNTGVFTLTPGYQIPTVFEVDKANSALQPTDIVDNTVTTTEGKVLSANMGKSLQDQIDVLEARGRFLSLWNSTTGLPETNPTTLPYPYKSGDYFIVGVIGEINYRPIGTSYTGVASTTLETLEVAINDTYYFDGAVWKLQSNSQKTLTFVNIAGDPYDNTNLAADFNAKYDVTNPANYIDLTNLSTTATGLTYDNTSGILSLTSGYQIPTTTEVNLANSAIQPGDNISELVNNANYIDLTDLSTTVTGLTYNNTSGVLSLTSGYQIPTTTEVGLANSAVQPGDNVSDLINDAGYLVKNTDITGGTGTKITYDSKGLVTSSTTLSASDIPALAYLPDSTKYGTGVDFTGSTLTLYDQDGTALDTATIVIPDSAVWGNITGTLSDQTDLQNALDAKQDELVSGTDIKTLNGSSLLGSGNIEVQETLVSGINIKTLNNNPLLGSGNVAVQEILVSGINIKTINNDPILGSGNISTSEVIIRRWS